jgi:hypothetical protein
MNEENKPLGKSVSPEMKKAISNIKIGWIAGVIIGGLGIIVFIIGLIFKTNTTELWPPLIFSGGMFGFSYGIYQRSRACSTIVLAIFVIACLQYAINGIFITALFAAIICIPFYIGLRGTFTYHKLDAAIKMNAKSQKS